MDQALRLEVSGRARARDGLVSVLTRRSSAVTLHTYIDAPTEASASHPKPGFWKSVDWKLMVALVLPVTLETLDYTGMYAMYAHSSTFGHNGRACGFPLMCL